MITGLSSNGLKMEIVFKRRLTNELLTTYLPSFLLVLMCYATSFFKPIYFEAAVTVNLSLHQVSATLQLITYMFVNKAVKQRHYKSTTNNVKALTSFKVFYCLASEM